MQNEAELKLLVNDVFYTGIKCRANRQRIINSSLMPGAHNKEKSIKNTRTLAYVRKNLYLCSLKDFERSWELRFMKYTRGAN